MHNIIAFNVELSGSGSAPERVELIPSGPDVIGRDGRSWKFGPTDGQAVLAAFNSNGAPLPIDWEHATEFRAPHGQDAPAAGWITELELRDGALVGRVEWTPKAAEQVANREYRFLSPVFMHTKTDRRILRLESAGLTNTPNLRLTALNRRHRHEEDAMDLKALCKALGLAETATMDEVVQAATSIKTELDKSKNQQTLPKELAQALGLAETATPDQAVAKAGELAKSANKPSAPAPDLTKSVPRADYDLQVERAKNAEAKLAGIETKSRDGEIAAEVTKAMAEGKIAPASKEFYLAMCRNEGGLEEFKKFAATAPVLIKDVDMPSKPGPDGAHQLTDTEQAVCRNLGLDPKEFAKEVN